MAITWADVVLIAPTLSAVPVGSQNAILADVALQLSASTWGSRYDLGSKYLAAHLGALYLRGGANSAGIVLSQTVGQVSQTFANPLTIQGSGGADNLDSTQGGREFLRLQRMLVQRVGMVP